MDAAAIEQLQQAAQHELKSGIERVVPQIEQLSQEQLLELVKTISLIRTGEAMLTGADAVAREDLDQVIGDIMTLQETVVGITQLSHDLQNGGLNE
jgi:CO dehydrogenase/acetyl-CoA synthase alpha subunit